MPTFKELLLRDIQSTFINQQEFASIHNLDGSDIPLILDSDIVNERPLPYAEGVYLSRIVVYVESSLLTEKPVEGQHMRLDQELYQVEKVSDEQGVYEITLVANES